MENRRYPISLGELERWRRLNRVTAFEARDRFVQYVVLDCIGAALIGKHLSFKGGNALRFVYGSPRSTIDLDFTADASVQDDEETIEALVAQAISRAESQHAVKMRVQRVRRNPPRRPGSTTPTYSLTVAYQLPGDRFYAGFESYQGSIPQVVKLEISLNDKVCETQAVSLDPGRRSQLTVCTLEDILAEKLRSILQQRPRKRHRRQDVFDIARYYRASGARLALVKISRFLIEKAAVREIQVTKRAYDEEARMRASADYEKLEEQIDEEFIPFEQAWALVRELVNALDIPE
ncbi:MAG: nucleotidyl transferase AbiEii/AbiGii toxin family protein [Planctomycetota bacterium]|nr:nucleotidyl transferase AbiEii/AbiGii toxin family protein [Planctomycetota bacterium]